jgi:ArsR family metal-binding transcriptional regulator
MKTITYELDFFPNDDRYMLLLSTMKNHKNVRIHEDGRITICLTEDDIEALAKLPKLYEDVNNLNTEKRWMRANQLLKRQE